MILGLEHNIPKKIIKLIKATQVQSHRPGFTSQAAIKGFFALQDRIVTTNGRMVMYVYCCHGLEPNKQYYINGFSVFPNRVSGFIPSQFAVATNI